MPDVLVVQGTDIRNISKGTEQFISNYVEFYIIRFFQQNQYDYIVPLTKRKQ